VRFVQRLTLNEELIEFICNENEQSAKHLLGKDVPLSSSFELDPKVFDNYAGRYQMAPGAFATFSRDGNRFFGQFGNLPPFEMFAASQREFFLRVIDTRFTFEVDASGRATAVVIHTDADRRAQRVP
jgi:hypothetical protein